MPCVGRRDAKAGLSVMSTGTVSTSSRFKLLAWCGGDVRCRCPRGLANRRPWRHAEEILRVYAGGQGDRALRDSNPHSPATRFPRRRHALEVHARVEPPRLLAAIIAAAPVAGHSDRRSGGPHPRTRGPRADGNAITGLGSELLQIPPPWIQRER
jgi:hypothetical protein